jgi:Tfp pilus assembly protein PilW
VHLKDRRAPADAVCVTSDRGDIVLGWLTKLVVTLSVLGVVGFDLISLVTTRFQAEDHAQAAARAAAQVYRAPTDLQAAYDAAVAEVAEHGDVVDAQTFAIGADGAVTLTLHRTASTLLVEKVSPVRHWTDVRATVTGTPAS